MTSELELEPQENYERILALLKLVEVSGEETHVAEEAPKGLVEANLPMFVVFEEQAVEDYATYGEEVLMETIDYNIVLYAMAGALGSNGDAVRKCRLFIPAVRQIFAPRTGLELPGQPDIAVRALYRGFSGPLTLEYPTQSRNWYAGMIFRERVSRLYKQDYDFY